MKKILLGTTALVAATAVTAGAAKADMSVTGWNSFGVGGGNVEGNTKYNRTGANGDFDIYENGEIYFNGATEMDNGMSLSWDVQLETENGNGNFIDENYFTIGADFGSVLIGQENLPNYKMHYSGGMWVGNAGISSASYTQFTGSPGGLSYFHSGFMNDTAPIGNDSDMLSYYSPRLGGVQIGLGYMPDSNQNDGAKNHTANRAVQFENVFSAGINYTGDMPGMMMDGMTVALSGGYTRSDIGGAKIGTPATAAAAVVHGNGADRLATYQAGLQLGFGGLTLGVSYMAQNTGKDAGENTDAPVLKAGDTNNLFLGVTYATGPHTVGLTGGLSEADKTSADKDEVEGEVIMLAHDYAMGGGVSLTSSLIFLDVSDEVTGTDSLSADGTAGMMVLNASF